VTIAIVHKKFFLNCLLLAFRSEAIVVSKYYLEFYVQRIGRKLLISCEKLSTILTFIVDLCKNKCHNFYLGVLLTARVTRTKHIFLPGTNSAGIFKLSMGARNRGLSHRPASLHSLAELVPWNRFLGSL
jgi:hypothetical protein